MKIEKSKKSMFFLKPAVAVCALIFIALPVMAAPASQPQENPHGVVWEKWQPLAEGYLARRRVPKRLKLFKEQPLSSSTQKQAQSSRICLSRQQLSLWFYTDAPGLYSVSLNDLSAETGIAVKQLHNAAKKGRLSFLNEEEPVSWYYDVSHGRLLFIGEAYETFYAEGNAYQLVKTQRPDSNRMAESRSSKSGLPAGYPTPFREALHFEEENDMMFILWLDPSNPDADYWFWDYLYGSSKPQLQIPLNVPNPGDYGTARIRVRLHGFTDLYPGDDHRVFAEINGNSIGSVLSWDGLNPAELIADFDQTLLNPDGENILTLYSDYDEARRPLPGEFLESITVMYDRLPVALNGQLWMRDVAQGTQEVAGFTGEDILVIESPVRNAVLRRDVHIYQDGEGQWAVAFEAEADSDYLIVEMSDLLSPVLDARKQSNLTAYKNRAQYLVIAPREFSGTAQALAEYRRSAYDFVKVVWLDDIYKSFSAGHVDPFAIGRFMDHVQTRWAIAPSTVTLVGKGSLDRKNCMGYADNFLPVLMVSSPWSIVPSDVRLLGVEDGEPPFAIGRLPIISDAEGLAQVNKINAHESLTGGDAAYRAVVVADNPDNGGDFHMDAERLAAQLSELGVNSVTELYHSLDDVRTNLIESETWEAAIVSYSGHGSQWRLGTIGENFFYVDDAGLLQNSSYPVFAALTCSAGLDAYPGTRSLAAALVLNPDGGAIAALAPTGLSLNTDAHILAQAFIDNLFGSYRTVGDALVEATHQTRGEIQDFMAPMYLVIGDPAVYALY